MKFVKTLLLWLFTLSFVTIQTLAVYSPKDTAFVADLDDVLINMSLGVPLSVLPKNPLQWFSCIQAMLGIKNRYKKINGKRAMEDDSGNKINGMTFQLLYCGMKDKTLLPYVATLIQFINQHRRFKTGTKEILYYLKEKGYKIYYATNKDHTAYMQAAESLGKDLTNLPWKVIVAQPGNNTAVMNQFKEFAQNTDLPDDYKALLQKTINAKPSGNIYHASIPKPSSEYFDKLRNVVEKKNIIFFDDREENTTAATRPNDNMIGIHFKNAIQFADELVRLGVLSEEKDKEFLEDLRKPKQNVIQQGWDYIKSFYPAKEKTA